MRSFKGNNYLTGRTKCIRCFLLFALKPSDLFSWPEMSARFYLNHLKINFLGRNSAARHQSEHTGSTKCCRSFKEAITSYRDMYSVEDSPLLKTELLAVSSKDLKQPLFPFFWPVTCCTHQITTKSFHSAVKCESMFFLLQTFDVGFFQASPVFPRA